MSKNLYVGNLSFDTTSDHLRDAFAQYGDVTSAQVITDRETGKARGFAFVEMGQGGDEAMQALNGAQLQGRTISVSEARPREERGARSGGSRGSFGGSRRY